MQINYKRSYVMNALEARLLTIEHYLAYNVAQTLLSLFRV
ncbi:hypothetical protein ES703_14052 [subsurface metagenome]